MKIKYQSWLIPAFALSLITFSKVSHGYNAYDWADACDITDPKILSLLESEAALIQIGTNPGQIHQKPDGNYQINTIPYTYRQVLCPDFTFNCQQPVDESSIFYGKPRSSGRSGVLIGPDLVLTASHKNPFDYGIYKVVFGLRSKKVNGTCLDPDWSNIPSSNVFTPAASTSSKPVINTYTQDGSPDYFSFYLTQPTGRPYLRMRRSGAAYPGNRAVQINHPERLSAKVTTNAEFFGNGIGAKNWFGVLINGGHALEGSSGGMVYNYDYDYIEAVSSWDSSCAKYDLDNPPPTRIVLSCPDDPYIVNGPISDVAETYNFPYYSLVASPQGDVTHTLPANPRSVSVSYTLKSPLPNISTSPTSWSIAAPSSSQGISQFGISPSATSGSLAAGGTYSFTANFQTSGQCGTYDQHIKVTDVTRGVVETLTHHFEVGLTEFFATPADGFYAAKMAPTFSQFSKTYRLENPRPTASSIQIKFPSWIRAIVTQGSSTTSPLSSPVTISLLQDGLVGDSAEISLSVHDQTAASLPRETTNWDRLTFTNLATSCKVTTELEREIALAPGRQEYTRIVPGLPFFPSPTSGNVYGAPLVDTIQVPDNFILDRIEVNAGLYNFPATIAETDLANIKIVLKSPQNVAYPLWDSTRAPKGYWFSKENPPSFGDLIAVLHINDTNAIPASGNVLAALKGSNAQGAWKIEISGNQNVTSNFAYWNLAFWGHAPNADCNAACMSGRAWASRRRINAFPRVKHSATLLPDGKVLVTGGFNNVLNQTTSDTEVYDPATNIWTNKPSSAAKRADHIAVMLPTGKVLVAGGVAYPSDLDKSAELYEPTADSANPWSTAAPLNDVHSGATGTLLHSGKVLVVGYNHITNGNSAEVYDPYSDSWSFTGPPRSRREMHSAVLLPNGKVLVTGGKYSSTPLATTEIFDPATSTWSDAAPMTVARYGHTTTLIPGSGKVIAVGGYGLAGNSNSVEVYDPVTNSWSSAASLSTGRSFHSSVLLPSGKLLVVGGGAGSSSEATASVEFFDPDVGTWSSVASMLNARSGATATLLNSGNVLIVNGVGTAGAPITSVERY